MIEYTQNNKINFDYGGEMFGDKTLGSTLKFNLAQCTRRPKSFKEECYDVARILNEKAKHQGRVPTILLSGGLDSEVVCKAFIEQDIPFEAVTFRFENELNRHEIHFVNKFCERHGIKTRFFDMDAVSFINSSAALELYLKTRCARTIMLPHMLLISEVWNNGGMPIVGGGDIVIHNSNGWKFCKYEYMLSWFIHSLNESIDGGVAFFQHTPEIILAMLNEKEIMWATDPKNINARILKDVRLEKYKTYHRIWPDFEKRPKYYGIELVFDLYMRKMFEFDKHRQIQYDGTWEIDLAEARKIVEPI